MHITLLAVFSDLTIQLYAAVIFVFFFFQLINYSLNETELLKSGFTTA